MKNRHLLLIIPTYNEAESIVKTIRGIYEFIPNIDILIIDDNSPDGTADILKYEKRNNKKITIMTRDRKLGLASAYKLGFDYALERGYKYIAQCDGDGSHSAIDLANIYKEARKYENNIIIGSRYINNKKIWKINRYLLSRMGNLYINLMMGISIKDATSGLRIYPREILKKIDYNSKRGKNFVFQVEMSREIYKGCYDYMEVGIDFKDRIYGKSKLDYKTIVETLKYVTKTRKN